MKRLIPFFSTYLLLIFLLIACSGATRGTGTSLVKGSFIDSRTGEGLVDAVVSVDQLDSGGQLVDSEVTRSDSLGFFMVELQQVPQAQVVLRLSLPAFDDQILIKGPEEPFTELSVRIVVDLINSTLDLESAEFVPPINPTPLPTTEINLPAAPSAPTTIDIPQVSEAPISERPNWIKP